MTKKGKTGLVIGATAACVAVLCAAGACNGIAKEEKAVCPANTALTMAITAATSLPTTTAPVTTTATTTAATTTAPQITTTATCTTTEQITAADATVPIKTAPTTTTVPAVTSAPAPTEPHHGQTSDDYIYINGFGWVFNEGGGYGETNYEMYCNGNKIGYFG